MATHLQQALERNPDALRPRIASSNIREFEGLLPGYGFGRVYGGPFREIAKNRLHNFGIRIKMAKEIDAPCTVSVPTPDFQTPPVEDLKRGLEAAIDGMIAGRPVYVGCMAGRGRTGLFMAVLAAVVRDDLSKPVEFVREKYYSHAVETPEQYEFVTDFIRDNPVWVASARRRLEAAKEASKTPKVLYRELRIRLVPTFPYLQFQLVAVTKRKQRFQS